jgi:ectoine hydroxylase-related dioxygenase (phytanoyl-CoA dioxygenase family)
MTTTTLKPGQLTDEQIEFFDREGYLILRQWITGDLLARLQEAGRHWIALGNGAEEGHPDYAFAQREIGRVFFRVDYLHDKGRSASLDMLGSPQVLGVAESLCGPNFIPTYESMVFKNEGDGEAIRWHQDAVHSRKTRVFNYDLYLDHSRAGAGALRVIPKGQTSIIDACGLEAEFGWDHPDAIDVEMEPGDVLLHDVMVPHGSARTLGASLRRTIYYEFRATEMIEEEGPWDKTWVDERRSLIPAAIESFHESYPDEPVFEWRPSENYRSDVTESLSLRTIHPTHTKGSYCSATSA